MPYHLFINRYAAHLVKIPEETIKQAAEKMGELYPTDSDNNSFVNIIKKIDLYKEAELTPLILIDPRNYAVVVVAEETFMKKLH